MKKSGFLNNLLILFLLIPALLYGQSGREYRRSGNHNANLVRTVFGNWGVIGQPRENGPRGAWLHSNNGYIGDVSPMVGAEIALIDTVHNDTVRFHSVEICPVERPTRRREESPQQTFWGFEPMSGYINELQQSVALSTNRNSWPPEWPDKMNDSDDPGWAGKWNGFFGKDVFNADQESYFVMDDNNDEEFNDENYNIWDVKFVPDDNNPARKGLGLEVKVRGMQWQQFLAQDCIFWLYEIKNTSTTDYHKVVFGMLVGTYVGVTGTDDSPGEYDDDYSFFDVEKDITYTADYPDNNNRNPNWVGEVGVVGYAFLESPGNPYDGIDNDGDADENPLFPSVAPLFQETDFDSVTLEPGAQIVIMNTNYERTVITVPDTPFTVTTFGHKVRLIPGQTKTAEGNVILDAQGNEIINPNAYDGIDNDLDGLIDENFYLHYRQIRKDQEGNILIDKLSPVKYADYFSGLGVNDILIDERRDDGIDNDGDWNAEFDDVGADGKDNTNDTGEGDGFPTAGEPNFDATDVDESDQIGLTSFEYFTPSNDITLADDEELWRRLNPGFFEVPASIVNNRPTNGEDGDFIYGSGYFPLRAGQTERFSLALVYGEGGGKEVELDDLLKNRETVQQIYNSDYRFPQAPEKPTMTAVPGDGQVTLYWDRVAEKSIDPVLKINDFEGYKIYKATDPDFNDVRQITNADGIVEGYINLAQFDIVNDIKGYFRAGPDLYQAARGYTFNLGNDTGLRHSFVDTDVENGRKYYYAVAAYDRGDEIKDIFPSENTKFISILPTGEIITDINTAVVVPNSEAAGYTPPEGSIQLEAQTIGTGNVYLSVIDETALRDHIYVLDFFDTSNDGIDNDGDWDVMLHDVGSDGDESIIDADGSQNNGIPDPGEPNIDYKDNEENFIPVTSSYSIKDSSGTAEVFTANDTGYVHLINSHLVESTVELSDMNGNAVPESRYIIDYENGKIRGKNQGDLGFGQYSIFYKYYPIYRSPYIKGSPYEDETKDSDIFDGLSIDFNNKWAAVLDVERTGWTTGYGYDFTMAPLYTKIGSLVLQGLRRPCNYEFQFFNNIVDTSSSIYGAKAIPVNFKILNVTDSVYIDFVMVEVDGNKQLSTKDEIIFIEEGWDGDLVFSWDIYFYLRNDTTYNFIEGDKFLLSLTKPFRRGDKFVFRPDVPVIDDTAAKEELNNVKVVPNPYVAATAHESPLPPGITSGRGARKVDFIHLPARSKVHIFTARGEHIITLEHDGSIFDGTVSWNLKTKENLDVAYGVYFYIVESPVGKKSGKLAIIK